MLRAQFLAGEVVVNVCRYIEGCTETTIYLW